MATQNNITVSMNVTDNGTTAKQVKNAHELKRAYEGAASAASKVGGTSGSRRVASAAYSPSSGAAMSEQTYSNLRGSAGATGASARDFANQSQGLGGLVRLYATYAANVFAVGAAFSALSNAMDTTNMVKGLNQLGAASGIALGNLSKRLVDVTDGALSMRQSMEAVAKASSSGMTSKQILDMGTVAKKASQALGVDMADAMSRITRAATKLEPELVDELGLFTKTGKAAEDYAKSIGKSVTELSDFEKRMAYSNALIAEGKKKFDEIEIDTNPYSKLLAAVSNTGQKILELINVGLTPLVSLLSSSPTALLAVIGAIGIKISRQALPELLNYKKSLDSLATQSKARQEQRLSDLKSSLVQEATEITRALDEQAEIKSRKFEQVSDRLNLLAKASASKRAKEISKKALPEITQDDLTYLDKMGTKGTKASVVYRDMASAIRDYYATESEYKQSVEDLNAQLNKRQSLFTAAGQNELRYHNDVNAARKRELTSQVANTASTEGFVAAMKKSWQGMKDLRKEQVTTIDIIDKFGNRTGVATQVVTAGVGRVAASINLLKNGVVGAVASVGTAVAAFLPWLEVIGLVFSGLMLLDGVMSKNSKEVDKFSSNIDRLKESAENVDATFEKLYKKPIDQLFNTASIQAVSNAFTDLSDTLSETINNLTKADKSAGTWDKFIDGFKTVIGTDLRSKFADTMTESVLGSLNKVAGSPEGKKAKEEIAKILSIDPKSSTATWNAAFARIASDSDKLAKVEQAIKGMSNALSMAAAKASEFDNALKASADKFTAVVDKFKIKDEIALLGESLIASSSKVAEVMKTPELAIQKLFEISTDFNKLKLFGSDDQANIVKYSATIAEVNKAFASQKSSVQKLSTELETLYGSEKRTVRMNRATGQQEFGYTDVVNRQIKQKEKELAAQKAKLTEAEVRVTEVTSKFPDLAFNQFVKGAGYVEAAISASLGKGAYALQTAVLNTLGDIPGVSKERTKIAMAQLNSDFALLKIQQDLIRATYLNTQETKLNTLVQAQGIAQSSIMETKRGGGTPSEGQIKAYDEATARVESQKKIVETFKANPKELLATYTQIRESAQAGNQEARDAVQDLYGYVMSVSGLLAKQREKSDKEAELAFMEQLGTSKEIFTALKKVNDTKIAGYANDLKDLDLRTKAGKLSEEDALIERSRLQNLLAVATARNEDLAISEKIAALNLSYSKLTEKQKKDAVGQNTLNEINRLNQEKGLKLTQAEISEEDRRQALIKDQLDLGLRRLDVEAKLAGISREAARAAEDTDMAKAEALNAISKASEKYTEKYQRQLDYELQVKKINSDAKRKVDDTYNAYSIEQRKLSLQLMAELERSGGDETERTAEIRKEVGYRTAAYLQALDAINATKSGQLQEADAIKALTDRKADIDSLVTSLQSFGDVWGGIGNNIVGVITAVNDFNVQLNKNIETLKAMEAAKEAASKAGDTKKAQALELAIADEREQAFSRELIGMSKMASASKKFFKEKSTAYKAFTAIERASQAVSLAIEIKTAAMKVATWLGLIPAKATAEAGLTAAEGAGAAARAPLTYGEIIGQYLKSIPSPWGMVAGVAAGAFFLSLLGGKGGGKSAPPPPSSAQRQEVQGSAMNYVQEGNTYGLVQTRRGVFGDLTAKSESINNSLEIIKANSVDGLSVNNSMLTALHRIANAVEGTAKTLYRIPGIAAGSFAGTMEGTQSKKGFLGLFGGSSTTTSIVDSGIKLVGTFKQLADAVGGSMTAYETVQRVRKKSGFLGFGGSTKTSYYTNTMGLNADAVESISRVFRSGEQLLQSIGSLAGVAESTVSNVLANLNVNEVVSLRGLTGEEFNKQLNNIFSALLDDAAGAIFSTFDQFVKFGEGMLETVIRVVDTNKKVSQALQNIGFGSYDKLYDVSEGLVDLSGGLDNFLSQINYFTDNFLSEADKLNPKKLTINKTFADLGIAVPASKAAFKNLVLGLNLTTEEGQATYKTLMDVAPAFSEVANSVSSSLKSTIDNFDSFIKTLEDLRSSLLLGTNSILTPLQKYQQSRLEFETTYAQALGGDKDAQSKLSSISNTFLEASKTYNASSDQYVRDFNEVLAKINSGIVISQVQKSAAEMQLEQAVTQTSLLEQIAVNTASLNALSTITGFASGGYAPSGVHLVGEEGPELVSFSQPGRVYNANQTAGMFAGATNVALVYEIQQLRAEVTKLRQQQREETGALISATFDAQNQNANQVVEAVVDTASTQQWAAKLQASVKLV